MSEKVHFKKFVIFPAIFYTKFKVYAHIFQKKKV